MFCAAVARILEPGIKFDSILVLDGDQGIGKSSLFREVTGQEFFSDSLTMTDISDKSGAEKLQGYWIVEIGELAGMRKADIEKVKAFVTTRDDSYRQSYGKTVESHLRQCVIVATVNGERGYLRDITGNRRFWVVKCNQTEKKMKFSISEEERAQIWAEALWRWKDGEKLFLEDEYVAEAEALQRGAMEVDERQGIVEEYLETLLPENWVGMDLYARRAWLFNPDDPAHVEGTVRRETVTNLEIWSECFGHDPMTMKKQDSYEIMAIMMRIPGWERTKRRQRIPLYGQQRLYRRTGDGDRLVPEKIPVISRCNAGAQEIPEKNPDQVTTTVVSSEMPISGDAGRVTAGTEVQDNFFDFLN